MKQKLTENLALKILAVVCSFILWFVVISINDPPSAKLLEIPIEFTNESVLAERSQTAEIVGSRTVSIKVTKQRSVVGGLTSSDFKAVADFSQMYQDTQVPIVVTPLNSKISSTDIEQYTRSVEVKVENIISAPLIVEHTISGEPGPGYAVGSVTMEPSSVTLTGPESLVSIAKHATVDIDVSGANDSFSSSALISLYDGNDFLLDLSDYKGASWDNNGKVDYHVEILQVQTISISVNPRDTEQVVDGYRYISSEVNPDTLQVAGIRSAMASVGDIEIGDVSVSGASESIAKDIDIRNYLPEGVSVYNADPMVTVSILIEEIPARTLQIPVTSIAVEDVPANMEYSFDVDTVSLTVRGSTEALNSLAAGDISLAVSLRGLAAGSQSVTVIAALPQGDYQLTEAVKVPMQLVEITVPETEVVTEAAEPPDY